MLVGDSQIARGHGGFRGQNNEYLRRSVPYIENHPFYGESYRNLATRLRNSLGETEFLSAVKIGAAMPAREALAIAQGIAEQYLAEP